MLKVANAFTWDANRKSPSPPSHSQSKYNDPSQSQKDFKRRSQAPSPPTKRNEHVHETEFTAKVEFPPVIKTTVEGQLKMEKIVGSQLKTIDHSIAKAYTIRDMTTHYRVRTKLGARELVLEETRAATADDNEKEVRSGGHYKLSVYEDGKEVGVHEANINVPDNMVSVLRLLLDTVDFNLLD